MAPTYRPIWLLAEQSEAGITLECYQDGRVAILESQSGISCCDDGYSNHKVNTRKTNYGRKAASVHLTRGKEQSSSSIMTPSNTPSMGSMSSSDKIRGCRQMLGQL